MSSESEKESSGRIKIPARPFPKHTLQEAIEVAKAIQEGNAGKLWKSIFLAKALDISPTSTNFRDYTSSAYKYGLVTGTWNAPNIGLTPLGFSITKPTDPKKHVQDLQKAATNVDIFSNIYEHYKDARIPSIADSFFKNVIELEFKVPKEHVEECIRILFENGKYANIIQEVKGSFFVVFSEEPVSEIPIPEEAPIEEEPEEEEEPVSPQPSEKKPISNQIFVAHGKNTVPLEQLKKILTEFKVPFKVAIDEPNVGRPISQKVANIMDECTSAIIIFTADEEYSDAEGKKYYRPSDNVVYELGAISIKYGNKIVILKEAGVTLASDFSDLGYISFEKDSIEKKTMDIIKELVGFGLLKVTPA